MLDRSLAWIVQSAGASARQALLDSAGSLKPPLSSTVRPGSANSLPDPRRLAQRRARRPAPCCRRPTWSQPASCPRPARRPCPGHRPRRAAIRPRTPRRRRERSRVPALALRPCVGSVPMLTAGSPLMPFTAAWDVDGPSVGSMVGRRRTTGHGSLDPRDETSRPPRAGPFGRRQPGRGNVAVERRAPQWGSLSQSASRWRQLLASVDVWLPERFPLVTASASYSARHCA